MKFLRESAYPAAMSTIMILLLFAVQAFAQAAAPAAPTFLDGILAWINGLSPTVLATVLSVVAEIGLRLYPSSKALSLLVPVKYLLGGLITILGFLVTVVNSLIAAANNVKPQ